MTPKACSFAGGRCVACGAPKINAQQLCGSWRPPGLGDRLASALESIGITKARVSAALGVKDCGCSKRQSALNALGRKLGIGVTQSDGSSAPPAGGS